MKYNVHLYAVVQVKVCNIEAASQKEAMEKAEQTDMEALFDSRRFTLFPGVDNVEYADEIDGYLVDEAENDDDHKNSMFYDKDKKPVDL